MNRYTTVEGLARKVLEALGHEGWGPGTWAPGEPHEIPDRAIECVANALVGDPERAKVQGIPDRQPDFVLWAQHGDGEQAGTSTVACLPSSLTGTADWCAVASFLLHHAAVRLHQEQGGSHETAMQALIEKALEYGDG